ncbi:MAG: YicC family protein [Nitrospinae bacterium]|nr:YicC family protein [Nitrospinota bacterium]
MASSMTGYGRAEVEVSGRRITLEGKSVNHRYIEINIKAAAKPFQMEEMIRKAVKGRFSRGYFDFTVTVAAPSAQTADIRVNEPLLDGYMKAFSDIAKRHHVGHPPSLGDILGIKDVFFMEGGDFALEENWDVIAGPLESVIGQIETMRKTEGQVAVADIRARLNRISAMMEKISAECLRNVRERHEKLKGRIMRLIEDAAVDEARFSQEAAILADKSDFSEEMERLQSHMKQVDQLLSGAGDAGRKLEFFLQEMNREANTLGSKAASPEITADVVEIKSEMEKIREQAQNLE